MKFGKVAARTVCVGAVTLTLSGVAAAQEKYLGEVFMTGANYCPIDTSETNGQLLEIRANNALFSLLGTTYGGDGLTTFRLPDLRGRAPIGQGAGRGLDSVYLGEMGGSTSVSLTIPQMPPHNHLVMASPVTVQAAQPGEEVAVAVNNPTTSGGTVAMTALSGTGLAVDIRTPFVGMRYCMVREGVYPQRP